MLIITGGTGFIGSHACVAFAQAGHDFLILDNLCNSELWVIDRLKILSGKLPEFIQGDIRDRALLNQLFAEHKIKAVIHLAGLMAVGESVQKQLEYYDNNVGGTQQFLAAMRSAQVYTLVFSSSATVYGEPAKVPIREDFPRSAINPYGRSKLIIEDILADLQHAEPHWRIARLRYFNPAGAHESGLIGDSPQGTPNNLMPYIAQVACGQRSFLSVFGSDYPTKDGTGVHDYIHVLDLAEGHVAALETLFRRGDLISVNLGTGGYSVLEMINAFEQASGKPIPYQITKRRAGDSAQCWAAPTLAQQLPNWKATRNLEAMCADSWHWQNGKSCDKASHACFPASQR